MGRFTFRRIVLFFLLYMSFGSGLVRAQQPAARIPELQPRRPECAILLPERDERNDVAKLVRAGEFLRCERDGFPADLAPPWKTDLEGEKKLGEACEYFSTAAIRDFRKEIAIGQLELARERCHINVMTIIIYQLGQGLVQPEK
ncbi:MAG: hypothetical protein ABR902_19150 [Candidatus Korobacteraceae bacterium]|jgi:hypothetical protein